MKLCLSLCHNITLLVEFVFVLIVLIIAYCVAYQQLNKQFIEDIELTDIEYQFYCSLPPEQWFYIVEYRGNWLKLDEQEIIVWNNNRQLRNQLAKLAMGGKNLITGK